MARLPDAELVRLVTELRQFPDPTTAIAVILGESGGDPAATNRQPDNVDRGLWQISSKWHPEVSDAAAYDPEASTRAAFTISGGGVDFNPWHATRSPSFPSKVAEAERILAANPPSSGGGGGGSWWRAIPVPGQIGTNVGTLTAEGTPINTAVGTVSGIVDSTRDVIALLGRSLRFLMSPDFWRRVGFGVAGVVLLYLGLAAIFGRQAVGLGITAASKGMVDGSEVVADDQDDDE